MMVERKPVPVRLPVPVRVPGGVVHPEHGGEASPKSVKGVVSSLEGLSPPGEDDRCGLGVSGHGAKGRRRTTVWGWWDLGLLERMGTVKRSRRERK